MREMDFKRRIVRIAVGIGLCAVMAGCESPGYYGQLVVGQLHILSRREPIGRVLADSHAPAPLKDTLRYVLTVREFAGHRLDLPVNNHYLTYVDLHRPYAVWNVFAAPELSLTPVRWSYPLIGSADYRGFFSETGARAYADTLSRQGMDVYVAGATAYSTLGWLDDAVFSTVLQCSRMDIAGLIFHELAHQVVFVAGDTTFNESFATAVQQAGLRRWAGERNDPEALQVVLTATERRHRFTDLVDLYRQRLERLYRSQAPAVRKRVEKQRLFDSLRRDYDALKRNWGGYAGYDRWFDSPLNNAKVSSLSAYEDLVPSFLGLLDHLDGDLPAFYRECRQIAGLAQPQRRERLAPYALPAGMRAAAQSTGMVTGHLSGGAASAALPR
jgi:predicted aminopeptidase